MKKEEILEKSRNSKEDEGEQFIENRSRRYGVTGFMLMFIAITLFNLINNIDNHVASILFFAYVSAEAFCRYRIGKNKFFLLTTICGGGASVLGLVNYVLNILWL